MTPKQKAEDMINTFRMVLMNEDTDCGEEILCTIISIKHALICVNEILEHAQMIPTEYEKYPNAYKYYLDVRRYLKEM